MLEFYQLLALHQKELLWVRCLHLVNNWKTTSRPSDVFYASTKKKAKVNLDLLVSLISSEIHNFQYCNYHRQLEKLGRQKSLWVHFFPAHVTNEFALKGALFVYLEILEMINVILLFLY